MNHSNLKTKLHNVARNVKAATGKAMAAGATFAAGTGLAMAQAASDVEAIIDAQKTLALAVVVAGTIAVLAIKYSKLARRA